MKKVKIFLTAEKKGIAKQTEKSEIFFSLN